MARFPCLPAAFLLLLLLALAFFSESADAQLSSTLPRPFHPAGREGSVPKAKCPEKCAYRCSETSHRKPCLFFCNYCCVRCLCVPSGTYGHKEECPCYNNMKTKEGKPKCP